MKATEQFVPVVLFSFVLYKLVLIFASVDEVLNCVHSNESYRAVLSCGIKSHFLRISRIERHSQKIEFFFILPKHPFG